MVNGNDNTNNRNDVNGGERVEDGIIGAVREGRGGPVGGGRVNADEFQREGREGRGGRVVVLKEEEEEAKEEERKWEGRKEGGLAACASPQAFVLSIDLRREPPGGRNMPTRLTNSLFPRLPEIEKKKKKKT